MADDPLEELGEDVALPDEEDNVEEQPDGSAIVKVDESARPADGEFFSNLAEVLNDTTLDRIAVDLLELIERDKESRSKRDKQYQEGIQRTGLGDDAPGGADFQGASRVVHPMLTEVCVDFSSRAIKELWPANGPAKSKIVGDVTKERVGKANRKSDFMNWQLTVQCPEARAEFEQLLTQLPLGGGQYMKLRWQKERNRPNFEFIAIDEIYLPYSASNFYSSQRKTHVQLLTQLEYDQRVRSGMYRDVDLIAPSQTPEQSKAGIANDKVEGRDSDPYNQDGQRRVFEIYVVQALPEGSDNEVDDDAPVPYIITVDETSRKTLAIYRNWEEEDPGREEMQHIVEFPFMPWRGAYPIGMTQMIGGLSGAATGALRALLDAAHIANSQSMLKLKGGTRGGQSLEIRPTEITEIEGGINVDDIRKLAMPLPFNQPSAVLFQLLEFLVESGKGVVRTTLDSTVESQENVPVGTTLARIEQATTVFSAIHLRLHNAIQMLLAILNRLNATYLDDKETKRQAGSIIASRSDFSGPMDVVPVSDPNIFSEAQRFAQMQAVAQRAQLKPELYKAREVEVRILSTMRVPAYDELLVPEMAPKEENAVAENVKSALGRPIVAFPEQDHIAHLKAHLPFMKSPMFGMSRLIAPAFLPVMLGHIKEHIVLWYAQEVFATASEVTDQPLSDMIGKSKSKEAKQGLDRLIAEASLDVVESAPEVFGKLPPEIEAAIAMLQQVAPPPITDPAVQVASEDVKMRGQVGMGKIEVDKAKLADKEKDRQTQQQTEQQRTVADQQAEQQRTAAETERERMRLLTESGNETAREAQETERERMRLLTESGNETHREQSETHRTELETASRERANSEDNATAITIAKMGDGGGTDPNPTP